MIVRDSNGSGAHDSIHKAIGAVRERVVIDPNMARAEDGNAIAISHSPPTEMGRGAPDHGVSSGLAVMDVKAMDNDIGHKLDCNAGPISNMHIGSPCINSLKAVHDQLLLQRYNHIPLEHNPERPVLNNGVPESARPGVHGVIIAGISHNIEPAISAPYSIAPKPNPAICEALTVLVPVGITSPAIINGVSSPTGEKSQFSPLCAVLDGSVKLLPLVQN